MYYQPLDIAIGAGLFTGFLGGTVIACVWMTSFEQKVRTAHNDQTPLDSTVVSSASEKSKAPAEKKSWLSLLVFWLITIAATIITTVGCRSVFEQNHLVFLNLFGLSSGEPNPFNFIVIVLLYNVSTLYYLSGHFKLWELLMSFVLANSFWCLFYFYLSSIMQGFR